MNEWMIIIVFVCLICPDQNIKDGSEFTFLKADFEQTSSCPLDYKQLD